MSKFLNPLLIDVDFTQFAARTGKPRGCTMRKTKFASCFAAFEDENEVIPEAQWKGLTEAMGDAGGLDSMVTRIFDQGQEGSCTSNATSQSHQIVQGVQFGKDRVIQLSAISLYKRCASGPNSGSSLDDNLNEMVERGVVPLSNPDNIKRFGKIVMPPTGFSSSFPSGWEPVAKQFRGQLWYDVGTFAGFMSALLKGFPVVYGRQSHCICAVRPVYDGSSLLIKYANSWGDWGENGFGYDSRSLISSNISGYGAWCLRSVTVPEFQTKP